jgi:hypothetical protein
MLQLITSILRRTARAVAVFATTSFRIILLGAKE